MTRAASSPQLLRHVNVEAVLAALRGSDAVTVTDLMSATGLTRVTAIAACEDLIAMGWVRELQNMRDSGEPYTKGRPARRFAFHADAGVVVGVDYGYYKVSAVVADLLGKPLHRVTHHVLEPDAPAGQRLDLIERAVTAALAGANVDPASVLAATVGVPAPVSRSGEILATHPFWKVVGLDVRGILNDRYGWHVQMENDANLAVLAERWQGAGVGVLDVVALLAGERVGAGVIESGRLLRGSQGGFGELAHLEHVGAVGDTRGIAVWCRRFGVEAVLEPATPTLLRELCGGNIARLSSEMVFAAAAAEDPVACQIVARVTSRLAVLISTVCSITNPEVVVICGAVAEAASTLVEGVSRELELICSTPARVVTSSLGDNVVSLGAVRHALDYVHEHPFDLAQQLTKTAH